MNMEELLEQLDEALSVGVKLPGKRCIVEIEVLRNLVDDIRMAMPNEIKQAKGICADRADIISNAKKEAESIKRNFLQKPDGVYDVVGPVCESSDVFCKDRRIPETQRGDIMAIRSAGAYGEAMAFGYNCREIPKAVFSTEL